MIKSFAKISEFSEKYNYFFVDLWGVIHDGNQMYSGVVETLQNFKSNNKKIIFVSNAPRRSSKATEKFDDFGVSHNLYEKVITSGEVTFGYINSGNHDYGKKYRIIGPERDNGILLGIDGYHHVSHDDKADFVVVTGFDNDDSVIDDVMPLLQKSIDNNLPMICANPDLIVVRISGKEALCAGVIANKYQEMGGKVKYFGKPYVDVYQNAFDYLQHKFGNVSKSEVAMIGDSIITDIKGANNFGIDSYLIPGGILAKDFDIQHGQLPRIKQMNEFAEDNKIYPTAMIPKFIW